MATDHIIEMKTFSLAAGQGVIHLKTSSAWGGGAYVLATVIQPRNPVSTPVPRRALGLVYVCLLYTSASDPGGLSHINRQGVVPCALYN